MVRSDAPELSLSQTTLKGTANQEETGGAVAAQVSMVNKRVCNMQTDRQTDRIPPGKQRLNIGRKLWGWSLTAGHGQGSRVRGMSLCAPIKQKVKPLDAF